MSLDTRWTKPSCASLFAVLVTFGCTENGAPPAPKDGPDQARVVARVGSGSISAPDFRAYLAQRPLRPGAEAPEEAVTVRLEEMIKAEVLYQEAMRLQLDQDPEVRRNIRQLYAQKLMDQVGQKAWAREIPEDELKAYYDRNWGKFNRPEERRLADIFIAVPAEASDAERAELKKKAEMALTEALAARESRSGLGPLITKYSDAPEKYKKGDTGFFDEEGKPAGIDKKLAEAAFGLQRVGGMPEEVVEAADGYHVVMLTGKRSAVHRPLKEVRSQLEQSLRREAEENARTAYVEGLMGKAEIDINEDAARSVFEEVKQTRRARGEGRPPPPARGRAERPPDLPVPGR